MKFYRVAYELDMSYYETHAYAYDRESAAAAVIDALRDVGISDELVNIKGVIETSFVDTSLPKEGDI